MWQSLVEINEFLMLKEAFSLVQLVPPTKHIDHGELKHAHNIVNHISRTLHTGALNHRNTNQ